MFCSAQLLGQEHAIELPDFLVMRSNLDVSRWLLVLRNISIRANGRGEDMSVHAFCALISLLGLIVVYVPRVVFLLAPYDGKSAEEGYTFSVVLMLAK